MKQLFFIFCCYFHFSFSQEAWSKVKVMPDLPANTHEKPLGGNLQGNWQLFFSDEFVPRSDFASGVDEKKWNFAEMGDDGFCIGGFNTPIAEFVHAIPNPENPQDGLLKMDISGKDLDTCRSIGSQIMTLSIYDDYRGYWFYPNSYMEIRVKYPADFNIGTGGFLYPAWQPYLTEIDLWETIQGDWVSNGHIEGNGNGKHDEYKQGYIWGESYKDPNFACEGKTKVMDKKGKSLEMVNRWWIFGLEWYKDKMRFYLNNELVRELNLNELPSCNKNHDIIYYPPLPMSLRITLQQIGEFEITLPEDSIKSLYVDYIRAYQSADSQVIKPMYIPQKICDYGNGGGDNISVRYYPDVVYEWSSPAFDFSPKEMNILAHCFCEMQWIASKPGLAWGTYPVYLKATLADGRVENHVWQVGFGHEQSVMPTNISVEPVESSGYYQLIAEGDSNSLGYEWSLDSVEWKSTLTNNWQPFSGGQTLDIWVKSRGVCGFSQPYKQIISIPISPESSVFSEDFAVTNPISGEKIIQEITVYNMMGSLIRRRLVLQNDTWEGVLDGLISGVYVVMYRDKDGKIVSLNKVYVMH